MFVEERGAAQFTGVFAVYAPGDFGGAARAGLRMIYRCEELPRLRVRVLDDFEGIEDGSGGDTGGG